VSIIIPRFDYRVSFSAAEDIGSARERHEDAYLLGPEIGLFAVADGMGGHAAGDVASQAAVDEARATLANSTSLSVLERYCANPDLSARRAIFTRLRRAVERANERIQADVLENPERRGMGTTLDLLLLVRNHAFIAHAGDARVYLARKRAMLQLTQDHGELEALKASGAVNPLRRASRNSLVNAVGLTASVTVDTLFVDLRRGDRLLLCTDGVHGPIESEARMSEMLRRGSVEQAARALVKEAVKGGRDNATAVVLEIDDRFVRRADAEQGLLIQDIERAGQCALLDGLPPSGVLAALSAAVEVEIAQGEPVPRAVANDLVTYILLDGVIETPDGRQVGSGGVVFPESLAGVWSAAQLPIACSTVRALRLRADDFGEVCAEPRLGADLYRRLAVLLARLGARRRASTPPLETVMPAPASESSSTKKEPKQ
jgi:serine/threonine protein phosphatase PrpC